MTTNWSASAETVGGLLVGDRSVDVKTVAGLGVSGGLLVYGCWFCNTPRLNKFTIYIAIKSFIVFKKSQTEALRGLDSGTNHKYK